MLWKNVKQRQKHKKKNIEYKDKDDDQKVTRLSRLLITINIPGSAGPLRLLVNQEDLVCGVIHSALKAYARQRRLPVLGSDTNNFLLYCSNVQFQALSPMEPIGSYGARSFMLFKKQHQQQGSSSKRLEELQTEMASQKQSRGRNCKWKAWFSSKSKALSV